MAKDYYKELKLNYSDITQTKLWKYIEANDEEDYVHAISSVCYNAIETCETITELLPNFTKHDRVHIKGVCDWIAELLGGEVSALLRKEAALLIMAVCCHDVGMNLSDANKKELLTELKSGNMGEDLKEYFAKNRKIENEYANRDLEAENNELYNRIIRDFVRQRHHLRVEEELDAECFNGLNGALRKELVFLLCRSHGESLTNLQPRKDPASGVRLYLLAVLLRLGDILNFDCSRSPYVKFKNAGLDNPTTDEEIKSANEHINNQISTWTINRETQTVICSGDCPDNQIAHDLLYYVDMVKKEVDSCTNLLTEMRDNSLIVRRVESNLTGPFTKGDFKLTVNAKKIIGLLGSENVYGDERAFLTELIQNSVDAILVRANLDSRFEVNDGRIDIYIWEDDEYVYARIDDNGIGMDKNIIESYFLAIGESYYNSYEFKKIIREGKVKFTPMNRFGIGLLSCFMGEEASMQVETKHVRGGIVYRMDITSLEGFYSLYEVDRSSKVNPLLRPNNSVMGGYNRQIGSSICVKKKKNTKDSTIEGYYKYLLSRIMFPLFDVYIQAGNISRHLVKKQVFLDAIEKKMAGKHYKKVLDDVDVYYLDNIMEYNESDNKCLLNRDLLDDCTTVIIDADQFIRYNYAYFFTEKQSGFTLTREGKEYLQNSTDAADRIIWETISEEMFRTRGNFASNNCRGSLIYNGFTHEMAIKNHSWGSFAYYFINGNWFDRVNLSKSILLNKEQEQMFLCNIYESICGDVLNMKKEFIDLMEEVYFEKYDLEKGEDEIIIENVKGNSKKYHYIVYLSLKYNIYINIDSEDRNYISGHFNMTDYVCENDIFYEYGIPAVYIDGNDDVLTWNQWINRNNVLIKWIEQHEESLIKEPDFNHIMFALRHPINHISWSHYFRELIGVIMKNNHYLFDEDLIKYIDIIDSEKSINQVIIASEEDFC